MFFVASFPPFSFLFEHRCLRLGGGSASSRRKRGEDAVSRCRSALPLSALHDTPTSRPGPGLLKKGRRKGSEQLRVPTGRRAGAARWRWAPTAAGRLCAAGLKVEPGGAAAGGQSAARSPSSPAAVP